MLIVIVTWRTQALYTQRQRNLKTEAFHPENASKYFLPSLEEFRNTTIPGQFGCVWGKLGLRNHVIIMTSSFFKKLCFQNVFRPHENKKSAFSNSSDLKSVFEKLRFRDGLVWTVGLTVEIKLPFQIPLAQFGKGFKESRKLRRDLGAVLHFFEFE